MSKRARTHIRGNVIGYLALFLALSGGTAQALDGSNTVFSDDIVDGQVKGAEIGRGEVLSPDIADGAVASVDLANDSVKGDDVREGTLNFGVLQARVRNACAGGQAISAVDVAGNATCVGSGGPPSGPAGGDLAGSYPNPTVSTADTVDGHHVTAARALLFESGGFRDLIALPGLGRFQGKCLPGTIAEASVVFVNDADASLTSYVDTGNPNPEFRFLRPGDSTPEFTLATADMLTWRLHRDGPGAGTATVVITNLEGGASCTFEAHALWTRAI